MERVDIVRDFYDPVQLGKRWGVSPKTIIREIRAGRLDAIMVGSQYRIPRDEVSHYEALRRLANGDNAENTDFG